MNDLPWMKVYLGSEMAKTISLSAEEFGAYERLRRYYWEHDGLPDDDRRLMRITGVDPERWEDVRSGICHLFKEGWRMPDLDAERGAAAEQRVKAVERSQRANAAKYGRKPAPTSNPPSSPTRNQNHSQQGGEDADLGGDLEGSPSASASDEGRYEERLAPTRTHARDFEGDLPFDPPQSRDEARRFLEKKGLGGRFMDSTIARLMDGKLFPSQLEHLVLQ